MTPTVVRRDELVSLQLADRIDVRIIFDGENGAHNVAMGTVILAPGSETPPHTRVVEEIIFVVSGTAHVITADARYALSAGDSILIPPGIEHFHANYGDETAEQVYLFAPQGPETVLRFLPAVVVPADRR